MHATVFEKNQIELAQNYTSFSMVDTTRDAALSKSAAIVAQWL